MSTTQQEEVEWIEYRDSFRQIAESSGIPLQNFFDLRGNHDKYGVPLRSSLDYHSKYSISAAMNRSSLVQSVTVQVCVPQPTVTPHYSFSLQLSPLLWISIENFLFQHLGRHWTNFFPFIARFGNNEIVSRIFIFFACKRSHLKSICRRKED